jgi:hypothetical protein
MMLQLPLRWCCPGSGGTEIFNPITYADVNFAYFAVGSVKPAIGWRMTTPAKTTEPNATGGYIIGSFDVFNDVSGTNLVAKYRLICEYGYNQNPEYHEFYLEVPVMQDYWAGNFRFGHSYGFLDDEQLWQFQRALVDRGLSATYRAIA